MSCGCRWRTDVGSIHHVSLEWWSEKIVHHVLDDDMVICEKERMEEDKENEKQEEKEKRQGEGQEKRGESTEE